jgi:hypothetical protein
MLINAGDPRQYTYLGNLKTEETLIGINQFLSFFEGQFCDIENLVPKFQTFF